MQTVSIALQAAIVFVLAIALIVAVCALFEGYARLPMER
jgi:hypothetical protein